MSEALDSPALKAAKEAQERVNKCLDEGRSFRLEAGAGAGKTYSLVAALKRLIAERGAGLMQAGQKIACITFTEVAKREIAQEIEDHPAILVDTIHAFSWSFMGQFQPSLRALVEALDDRQDKIEQGGGVGTKPVEYSFGIFKVDDRKVSLEHDHVPLFMARLLSQEKFRRLLTQQYPIIFIDEYQDTDVHFMASLNEHFFGKKGGPLIGLFGDHWQTIYRSEYELATFALEGIDKQSNFRSVPAVVNVLNGLRPDLPQHVKDPHAVGEARFFHANSYTGPRTNEPHSKNDLPSELARKVRQDLLARLEAEGWDTEKTKILMLTHNALAVDQGYPAIASIFKSRTDNFVRKEEPSIKLFAEVVEPMCAAYQAAKYGEMFRIFGSGPAIRAHSDKLSWRKDMDELLRLRLEGTVGDVIEHLKKTGRPLLSDRVRRREEELTALDGKPVPEESGSLSRYNELRAVQYAEMIKLVNFIEGQTPFATKHSVKGAEFENVLVVLGGGWNHYNWPQLLELLQTKTLTKTNTKGYYRARNLFYVSVSRPMKRLAVLATQTLSQTALASATQLFGVDKVVGLKVE